MAAVALIRFDQADGTGGVGGQAHRAVFYYTPNLAKNEITVTNDDNTDVSAWKIELLYNPPGSSLGAVPGTSVVLAQATSSLPLANFYIDAPYGCYRVRLTVWDEDGVADVDIRNVGVPDGRGITTPPYQKLPDPLPVLGSGLAGEKPDELNFDGQVYGWLGNGGAGLHYDFFRVHGDLPLTVVTTAVYTIGSQLPTPMYLVDLNVIGGNATLNLPTSGWRVGQTFYVLVLGGTNYKVTVVPPGAHTINGRASLVLQDGSGAILAYARTSDWRTVGTKRDPPDVLVTSTPFLMTEGMNLLRVRTTSIGAESTINLGDRSDPQEMIILDDQGGADVYPITVVPPGGHNINGEASVKIHESYGMLRLYYDGSVDWRILSSPGGDAFDTNRLLTHQVFSP